MPDESMVPRAAVPPAVWLTDHVTDLLALPVTVAMKVKDAPARMFAVLGLTATETDWVGGGIGGAPGVWGAEPVLPQEEMTSAESRNREVESARRIGSILGGGERENNWTEGQKKSMRVFGAKPWFTRVPVQESGIPLIQVCYLTFLWLGNNGAGDSWRCAGIDFRSYCVNHQGSSPVAKD